MATTRNKCPWQNPVHMSNETIRRRQRRQKAKTHKLGEAIADTQRGISDLKKKNNYVNPRRRGRGKYWGSQPRGHLRNQPTSTLITQRLNRRLCSEFLDYLGSLSYPYGKADAIIPDFTTFPRGVSQIRTIGTIFLLEDDPIFILTVQPQMYVNIIFSSSNGSEGVGSYILIDGVKYGNGQVGGTEASCHDYDTWGNTLDSYRTISMGLRVRYIGKLLNTSGMVTTACIPSAPNPPSNYGKLSSYNYAYTGRAGEGCSTVWFPEGNQAFELYDVDEGLGYGNSSCLQFASRGTEHDTEVFEVEVVMNIETYSDNQMLTAKARAGKPDAMKLNTAGAAMAEAHEAKTLSTVANGAKDAAAGVIERGIEGLKNYAGNALMSSAKSAFESFSAESLLADIL